jgi:hypothetical protein
MLFFAPRLSDESKGVVVMMELFCAACALPIEADEWASLSKGELMHLTCWLPANARRLAGVPLDAPAIESPLEVVPAG